MGIYNSERLNSLVEDLILMDMEDIYIPKMNKFNESCFNSRGRDSNNKQVLLPIEIIRYIAIPPHVYLPCTKIFCPVRKDNPREKQGLVIRVVYDLRQRDKDDGIDQLRDRIVFDPEIILKHREIMYVLLSYKNYVLCKSCYMALFF